MNGAYEMHETILSVENVSLSFGDKKILKDINVEVKNVVRPNTGISQGQVVAFLGPSGRGKTQFSKILAGLQPPTTGKVLVNHPQVPVRAGMVGYVTQNYFLRRNRTLLGNLVLAAKQAGMNSKLAKEKSMYYVELFELTPFIKQYPDQLSGGQRQRVAIAQQLLCSSHYLIMDEPFASLDPLIKEKVCDLIIQVSQMDEFNTLIIVSHDIRSVLKVADTVWMLGQDQDENGKLIPGAYIKNIHDLMAMDLCWDPAIFTTPRFNSFVHEVEAEFHHL